MNSRIKSNSQKSKVKKIISFCLFLFLNSSFLIFNSNAQTFSTLTALTAHAGINSSFCPGDSVRIGGNPSATGGNPPYTYSWLPTTGLNPSNSANPYAHPYSPTNYTLTVKDSLGHSSSSTVSVGLYVLPTINAGPDQTIMQGMNTQLHANGGVLYDWTPTQTLTNQNSASPSAEPVTTTTYCVVGVDNHGCVNYDCMILDVIPSDTLVFYNAFSPNGDGNNDVFFIGNLAAYPENKLEIYNRNGKMVYEASPYTNDWNGKIDGVEIPCATYYYILYPGRGKPNKQGAVTIIR